MSNQLYKITDLSQPYWHALFFVVGGVILLILGVSATLTIGVASSDDRVFAVEALVSGLLTEFVFFRKLLKRKLVLLAAPEAQFIYIWPLLCLYVFIAQPFE